MLMHERPQAESWRRGMASDLIAVSTLTLASGYRSRHRVISRP